MSALIDRLSGELDYPVLTLNQLDDFAASREHAVLFFTEDPKRFPESNDVAVVLPELVEAFEQRIAPAVVAREDEKKLQSRYGFKSWPALVFLRHGEYVATITGIQDWSDYLTGIQDILASSPSRPPSVGIPVVSQ